jgi:hypothetical protein
MHVMTTCWACEASLDPVWKFCTQCGVPVEKDGEIPSAIRPAAAPAAASLSPIAIFGLIMGGIAVVLVVSAVLLVVLRQ